jgi:hypothetical protein
LAPELHAQKQEKDGIFVRVYNLNGKKVAKGYIQSVDRESVTVVLRGKSTELPVAEIGKLRLKRSYGNAIVRGTYTGLGIGAVLGVAYAAADDSFSSDLGLVALPAGGAFYGGVIGAIIGIFRKPVEVEINGQSEKLQNFYSVLGRPE